MPEYSPQEIAEYRLRLQVDAMIARDKRIYQHRAWLMAESKRKNAPEKKVRRKPGVKLGTKRGHYFKPNRKIPLKDETPPKIETQETESGGENRTSTIESQATAGSGTATAGQCGTAEAGRSQRRDNSLAGQIANV